MLIQKCSLFTLFILLASTAFTQNIVDVSTILPDKLDYNNISVKKLYSDSNCTSFVIWVKQEVKSHKHISHTETIQILEGTAEMTVDKETFEVKANDFFVIPQNTFHAVKVTSITPLKLISIQSPIFNGNDRIFEEK